MRILVEYPSGRRFYVEGQWFGPIKMWDGPNILGTAADGVGIQQGTTMIMLDPRGRCTNVATGECLYTAQLV